MINNTDEIFFEIEFNNNNSMSLKLFYVVYEYNHTFCSHMNDFISRKRMKKYLEKKTTKRKKERKKA